MNKPPRRKHSEVMREHLPLKGARVADIGCGDGSLARFMTREGATVTGIEPSERQLARARAAEPTGGETYLQGVAEHLPFEDESLDAAVFFNSLHHVPVEGQARALAEAARVVRTGGLIYVQEPLAAGPHFELVRPIEDETVVRAKAEEAIEATVAAGLLVQDLELVYEAPYKIADFEAFKAGVIAVDEGRRPRFEAMEEDLRTAFEALAERRDDGYWLFQPARLNLLRKAP
ncbi:MAG: class I SAM-dependent methyltransferase [Rhodospirillales bacterium]|nr:class I SAM-dependent methyltransferase [Rhodospirillales bacterium]MDH3969514.1 class I SAM-dependent methyltransferase [Rhodospirillales bacterium]